MRGAVRGEAGIRGNEWPFDMCYDSAVRHHARLGHASCVLPPDPPPGPSHHLNDSFSDEKEKRMQGDEREKNVSGDAISCWAPSLHTHPTSSH